MTGPALELLGEVRWKGSRVPGERVAALLIALARHPTGLSDARLVEEVWPDAVPANPVKALQVLVSRVRAQCGPDVVVRGDSGYRLGLAADDVDLLLLHRLRVRTESALASGDPAAVELSARALDLAATAVDAASGPRADLVADVRALRPVLVRCRARALVAAGRPAEALPFLEQAHQQSRGDAALLAALLRAEAAVAGAATALERYEAYRSGLADRLGVDPDPDLQRLHQELLAADDPVRTGVRFDGDELLGREDDLTKIRAAMASGRLTTVLGPGGIGKTRIAQVLARESTLPRVHVVELVGVAAADDVVAEVGAVLGVRGSVTSRHTLSPAQQADVRARIAQQLDAGPTLLVLDNCEHVLEASASLVAFLLATTRDLQVLTTSRAPLRIAAERAVPLSLLETEDAAALFCSRARAVRPDAELDPATVAAVVERLDGLPLAIEIAAARVRTLSVEEVRRRLDDRFTLLRSRDRGLPARHRTLTAVIEWSWDLLSPGEQHALALLSVFHDGFDGAAVDAVLGPDGADLVETLAEHSLVVVTEVDAVVRMRMLETIREFAGLRLVAAGDQDAAWRAQERWAVDLVGRCRPELSTGDQVVAIDTLSREENNLTDVLRRALAAGDASLVARLVSALGLLWTITGEHARIFAVVDSVEPVLSDWDPPADVLAVAQEAAALLVIHLSWLPGRPMDRLCEALARWGEPQEAWARAAWAMFVEGGDDPLSALESLVERASDRATRQTALMWASLAAENSGDVATAAAYARRGLDEGPTMPYLEASLLSQLAQLAMWTGEHHEAARYAELAWPMLVALHAHDDARSLRLYTAMAPLLDGDDAECERILDEVDQMTDAGQVASRMVMLAGRAELALARGDVQDGLARYDAALDSVLQLPPGQAMAVTPWLLLAASGSLVAHVLHAADADGIARARALRDLLVEHNAAGGNLPYLDLPLNGVPVVAVGAWLTRFGTEAEQEDGIRLLAIGDRWAYNRSLPAMAWAPLQALAERARPGRLAALREEYADRPGYDLVPETRLLMAGVTSSG